MDEVDEWKNEGRISVPELSVFNTKVDVPKTLSSVPTSHGLGFATSEVEGA